MWVFRARTAECRSDDALLQTDTKPSGPRTRFPGNARLRLEGCRGGTGITASAAAIGSRWGRGGTRNTGIFLTAAKEFASI